ncbi:uncharacterized protein [Amphiura filiformis]|uniref:uncharacterized protein n=1 Tax=Amphiura filiformis TaxID=82378 RepID=UPI003B21877E
MVNQSHPVADNQPPCVHHARARCDSMPVTTRPARTSLSRLGSHESDEGTIPKEETSPSSSSSVIRPRTCSEGESSKFRSHRSMSGGSSPTKGRGRFSNIRNSTSSLRPTSVHRIVAQPMSNSPPIPNSPLSESPSQQGIAEERYVTYGPGDTPGPDEYGYGNSPAGEPHYSRPHHGSLRCRTPESPTHTPIREESLEIADEYMNMSPSASSKALPVPQGRCFSVGSSGISSVNRFGTFPFRHHGHHHHHHIHAAGSAESEPSLGHSSSPYEPDSYMAMNPGHQKRSNSAGFLCTTPTTTSTNNNSSTTTNHRSGSLGSKEIPANGNEGYMMMAPSTKGSRPGSRRGSGNVETPVIRHSSVDEPESYMMMTPSSRSSSISGGRPEHLLGGRPEHPSPRSASLDIPSSYRPVSPSQQLSSDSYMNMEFQARRANSLDKDAGVRMRVHRQVTRTSSNTSSEEPASYMNVSFGASSSPKSASSNEGYAYMEPSSKKKESGQSLSNVPQSAADGTSAEKEGEYVNVNFDQRKKSNSCQEKRNIPPALVLKNSPSDTSEYMNALSRVVEALQSKPVLTNFTRSSGVTH